MLAGDVWNDHMQPGPVGQHRVHEGLAEVDAAPGALEHPLHEILDLTGGQDRGGQLTAPAAGDEHPAGLIDPHFFDRRIVKIALQRPESGDSIVDGPANTGRIAHRRQSAQQHPLFILGDNFVHERADYLRLAHRIQPAPADEFAYFVLDNRPWIHRRHCSGQHSASPRQLRHRQTATAGNRGPTYVDAKCPQEGPQPVAHRPQESAPPGKSPMSY